MGPWHVVEGDAARVGEPGAITVDPGSTVAGDASGYCNACFTGRYPIEVAEAQAKLSFEGVLA